MVDEIFEKSKNQFSQIFQDYRKQKFPTFSYSLCLEITDHLFPLLNLQFFEKEPNYLKTLDNTDQKPFTFDINNPCKKLENFDLLMFYTIFFFVVGFR